MINIIRNKMKITPIEPTFINTVKSFFEVIRIRIGYIMKPQYDWENVFNTERVS